MKLGGRIGRRRVVRMGKGSGKRSGRGSSIHGVSRVMKDSLSVEMVEGIGMECFEL